MLSKVAKHPVILPAGVSVEAQNGQMIFKKGKVSVAMSLHVYVTYVVSDGKLTFVNTSNSRNRTARSILGTTYASARRLVGDVSSKCEIKLSLVGVGYKAVFSANILTLSLGFSHAVKVEIPSDINVSVDKNTTIIISGENRKVIMDIATSIRTLRKPEPYKGKGVFINDEVVRRKAGKKK